MSPPATPDERSPDVDRPADPVAIASVYDPIAGIYDVWSRSVTEDISFYVEHAVSATEPVVELAVGTGRVAVAVAQAGVRVIGVDSSPSMLGVCRQHALEAGVAELVELRLGDLAEPPIRETVGLVMVPFRSYLHLHDDALRLRALGAVRAMLRPGGRLVFDVFCPSEADITETDGRWLEREPGIWERALWDRERQRLMLSVRSEQAETTMELAWLEPHHWLRLLETSGFHVEECYGWFDRRPFDGGEDTVWVARSDA